MDWSSLRLNGLEWRIDILGEQALILTGPTQAEAIHNCARLIGNHLPTSTTEVVPAMDGVTIVFDPFQHTAERLIEALDEAGTSQPLPPTTPQTWDVPICYELGLDWEAVETATGLPREEAIQRHLSGVYRVALIGFQPGFVYLEGLDARLSCPRKENPRSQVPPGSVGLAGEQTGIYSLPTPGGWQIIGRTPLSFFEGKNEDRLQPLDSIRFVRIDETTFNQTPHE